MTDKIYIEGICRNVNSVCEIAARHAGHQVLFERHNSHQSLVGFNFDSHEDAASFLDDAAGSGLLLPEVV